MRLGKVSACGTDTPPTVLNENICQALKAGIIGLASSQGRELPWLLALTYISTYFAKSN
jgi:hypothetical protein